MAFFAAAATAQESTTPPVRSQIASLGAPPTALATAVDAAQTGTPTQGQGTAGKQTSNPPKPPTPPTPKTESNWPTVEASMVGYIDNAIVGSELRVRFDAAFNDQFPDRAEFIYGKCGCYRNPTLPAGVYDPNAPGPGPGVPQHINFQVLSFMGEYAPKSNRRLSAFIEIPFRWVQPQGVATGSPVPNPAYPNGAGLSDVEAGLKFAVLASPSHYLTAQLKSYFPSGSARHGLGTNHYSIEPALLYYQRFPDKFELEGEVGGWLPISGSAGVPTTSSQGYAGNIFFYGIGPSYRLVDHDTFRLAPVIELVGWNITQGLWTAAAFPKLPDKNASGINIVNLKIGARLSFPPHSSVYVGYGTVLSSNDWYNDILRVEYRYSF